MFLTLTIAANGAKCLNSTKHNLITPFIIREAGLTVSKVPKIHCDEPTVEDHSIYDDVTKIRIPLKLDGIFFYFPTRDITLEEMQCCDWIKYLFLSPDAETWDPYYKTFALNEEHLADTRGEIVYPSPLAREVFKPMEVGEVRTEPLDNMVEQVSAYDKVVDALTPLSAVVLESPPSIEK